MSECLAELGSILSETVGAVQSLVESVGIMNMSLMMHTHFESAPPHVVSPSPTLQWLLPGVNVKLASVDTFSAGAGKWNMVKWRNAYLSPNGAKKIQSKWNNVN
jgi:hypothetical protein